MYYLLSILTGILIAAAVAMNGGLTNVYGLYSASVFIHLSGLLLISIMHGVKKLNPFAGGRVPLYLYLGGVIGVLTVVFTNLSFGKISVSAILALGLLGQCIASLIVDQFGLFGMPRHSFAVSKLIGIALASAGIVVMILPFGIGSALAVILSLTSGFTIVFARTINAKLALKKGIMQSTFFNYFTGFAVSAVLLAAAGLSEPLFTGSAAGGNVWIYAGGAVGVVYIMLSNLTVSKIPSFYMTLLLFAGQVFAGIVIDIIISKTFSIQNLAGGLLVTAGLFLNVLLEKRNRGSLITEEKSADNSVQYKKT